MQNIEILEKMVEVSYRFSLCGIAGRNIDSFLLFDPASRDIVKETVKLLEDTMIGYGIWLGMILSATSEGVCPDRIRLTRADETLPKITGVFIRMGFGYTSVEPAKRAFYEALESWATLGDMLEKQFRLGIAWHVKWDNGVVTVDGEDIRKILIGMENENE